MSVGPHPNVTISKSTTPCTAPHQIYKLGYGSSTPVCAPAGAGAEATARPWWLNGYVVFPPLDYTDWRALLEQRRWLQAHVGGLLKSIDYRIKEWPQRFARERHQYRENASLIAMSEFAQASSFCRCGTIGSGRGKFKYGRCNVWKLCPYCSHKKRMEILRKFLPVFQRGRWWFLTISPVEMRNLNPCTTECFVAWWEACRYALDTLIKAGVIKGAFILETLSVHAYWPHAVALPHVHVVILADAVTRATTDELNRLLASYHGQWWDTRKRQWVEPDVPRPIWCAASTRTYAIRRDFDFASVLSYLCNPVNLAAAYIQDWPKVAGNRRDAIKFNENVIEAVNAWCAAMYDRWGHKYMAALQHAHNDFTGIKKSTREKKQHRRLVKDMLEDCRLKRMIQFDPNDLGTPVEFEDDKSEGE